MKNNSHLPRVTFYQSLFVRQPLFQYVFPFSFVDCRLHLEMNFKEVLCVIIFISMVETLRLNRQKPSTVWGVQKKIFRQKPEKEFFTSKDGTYEFEYDTGSGQHQMFRREKRYVDGTVVGFYGYVDPDGILRITEYMAGRQGFKQRTILRYPVRLKH